MSGYSFGSSLFHPPLPPRLAIELDGTVSNVLTNTSATIVQLTITKPKSYLYSFSCSGDTNGIYTLNFNNIAMLSFITNITTPSISYPFPIDIPVAVGTVVSLQVMNVGDTTANYIGSIFGLF